MNDTASQNAAASNDEAFHAEAVNSEPMKKVNNGQVELAIWEWGDHDKPTVVLVHGYPDTHSVWMPLVALLKDKYHVVAYDVRGAGYTSRPTCSCGYTLRQLTNDFELVINAVSPNQPVHVIGHDWGSIQGWDAVTEPRLQHRIASFTTMSAPNLDHFGKMVHQAFKKGSPDRQAVIKQFFKSWYMYVFHLPLVTKFAWKWLGPRWAKMQLQIEGTAPPYVADTIEVDGAMGVNLYRANMVLRLSKPRERPTQLPIQQLIFKQDKYILPEILRCAEPWCPNLTRHEFDGGHWTFIHQPATIAPFIVDHIDKHEGKLPAAS